MRISASLVLISLAAAAAPLSAQIVVGSGRVSSRAAAHVPPGQLPPRGMCRVWIDGVPPGQQPPVTDCVTAQQTRVANSRVIYGDQTSFPGRGKRNARSYNANGEVTTNCSRVDAVVVNGQVVDVCRDNNTVIGTGTGKGKSHGKKYKKGKHGDDNDDQNDDN